MEERNKLFGPFLLGIAGAIIVPYWWNSEVAARIGDQGARGTFHCLLIFGTGDCVKLWWVGLHETNQFASLVFWGAVGLAIWSLARAKKLMKQGK